MKEARPHQHSRGFTLLEMLCVMTIVGLLSSLIAPRIGSSLAKIEKSSQIKEIEDQIRILPRRVRYIGKPFELPRDLQLGDIGDGKPALSLPPGWRIVSTPPLLISSAGACSRASVQIVSDDIGTTPRYEIAEIGCEIKAIQD